MKKIALSVFLLLGSVQAGFAQGQSDDWEFRIAPYLWGLSIEGSSTIGTTPPLDIDADFSDILSNLNMALSLHTEFAKGKWTFVLDPTYIRLEMDDVIVAEMPPVTIDLEINIWLIEAWTSYEVVNHWEAIGGLRWQSQTIDAAGTLAMTAIDEELADEDWTDFFVGFRTIYDISDNWFFVGRMDVVVAGDSDTSWNVLVSASRRLGKNDNMALTLGYRYFEDDLDTGSGATTFIWDVEQHGPFVGYTWIF